MKHGEKEEAHGETGPDHLPGGQRSVFRAEGGRPDHDVSRDEQTEVQKDGQVIAVQQEIPERVSHGFLSRVSEGADWPGPDENPAWSCGGIDSAPLSFFGPPSGVIPSGSFP